MLKPRTKDYNTCSGMHAAMSRYANFHSKPEAKVTVMFNDGSAFTDCFYRWEKVVKYKTIDGLEWEEKIHVASFDPAYVEKDYKIKNYKEIGLSPVTFSQLRKLFDIWIGDKSRVISVHWE